MKSMPYSSEKELLSHRKFWVNYLSQVKKEHDILETRIAWITGIVQEIDKELALKHEEDKMLSNARKRLNE